MMTSIDINSTPNTHAEYIPVMEKTFRVVFDYNSVNGTITTKVFEDKDEDNDYETEVIKLEMTENVAENIQTHGGFYRFAIGADDVHKDAPTYGWSYQNLVITAESSTTSGGE